MKKFWLVLLSMLLVTTQAFGVVSTTQISTEYVCAGSAGPYSFSFPISGTDSLQVVEVNADGAETPLSSASYTMVPVNNDYGNGGKVTLALPCDAGYNLVLRRATALTQESKFTQSMPALYKTVERGLDKLTEIVQEQAADIATVIAGSAVSTKLYWVGASETDNGAVGDGSSLYDILTANGSTNPYTVVFGNASTGVKLYPLLTSFDASAYSNVSFVFMNGARLLPALTKTLTLYSPANIIAQPNQQIIDLSSGGSVSFSSAGELSVRNFSGNFDGSTDDQATIQSAITSLPAGSTLLFPYSSTAYYTESAVDAKDGVSLKGENRVKWEIKDSGSIINLIDLNQASNLTISGFYFYSDGTKASKVYAIQEGTSGENVTIEDCKFEGMSFGVKIDTANSINYHLSNLDFVDCADVVTGSGAILSNGTKTQIDHIYGSDIGNTHIDHLIYISSSAVDNTISNVIAEDIEGYAISTSAMTSISNVVARDCYGGISGYVNASNIQVFDQRDKNESGGSAFYLSSGSTLTNFSVLGFEGATALALDQNSLISNGLVQTTATYYDAVGLTIITAGTGLVLDNIEFKGTGTTGTTYSGGAFFQPGTKTGWTIRNCKFYDVVTGANPVISVNGTNVTLENNEFNSSNAANFHLIGIQYENNAYGIIKDNVFKYTTGTPTAEVLFNSVSTANLATVYYEQNQSYFNLATDFPTIASATDITINSNTYAAYITGTANIANIYGTVNKRGRTITLLFAGSLDLLHNEPGNLRLSGGADVSVTANDLIKLTFNGSVWYQSSPVVSTD